MGNKKKPAKTADIDLFSLAFVILFAGQDFENNVERVLLKNMTFKAQNIFPSVTTTTDFLLVQAKWGVPCSDS